jgi:hypothetical protein
MSEQCKRKRTRMKTKERAKKKFGDSKYRDDARLFLRAALRGLLCLARRLVDQKLFRLLPSFIAAFNHLGVAPRPAHVSPPGPLYFGATFRPFVDPRPRFTTNATEAPSCSNCFSRDSRAPRPSQKWRGRFGPSSDPTLREHGGSLNADPLEKSARQHERLGRSVMFIG